jgi:hypothetical protein
VRSERADDLLRRLGSGVRPAAGAGAWSDASGGSLEFQRLLRDARRGELSSGRSVRLAPRFGFELTDDEQQAIDRAADAAEAAGASTLLAVLHDAQLRIDVPTREAVEARPLRTEQDDHAGIVTGIDAAVILPPPEPAPDAEDSDAEPLAPRLRADASTIGPPGRIESASLYNTLARPGARTDARPDARGD